MPKNTDDHNRIVKKTMSYVADPVFSERQLVALVQKTPKQFVKSRVGRGGKQFPYVTGSYVQMRLNQVFGWCWSFEVKDSGKSPSGASVWVLGKLSVIDPASKQTLVVKEQFGSSEIKTSRDGKELDYADDLKSAATDALKKCASLLGVAADIYADPQTATEISLKVDAVVDYQRRLKSEATPEQDGEKRPKEQVITEPVIVPAKTEQEKL